MNHATSNRRLERLAKFLDQLPRKRFRYTSWVGGDWGGRQDLSCGTTACALGWAATIPTFRRLGLRLQDGSSKACVTLSSSHEHFSWDDNSTSFYAASHVFGLTGTESRYLFAPNLEENNATPKQVARKIRRFIRQRSRW